MLAGVSDGTLETLYDFIRKTGSFNGNVSTNTTISDKYLLDMELTIEGTDFGDAADHVLTATDCDIRIDMAEGEPDNWTLNATVYGSITAT